MPISIRLRHITAWAFKAHLRLELGPMVENERERIWIQKSWSYKYFFRRVSDVIQSSYVERYLPILEYISLDNLER